MSTDPYATTSTVKNILQHVISPKIVNDGNGGYQVKTDLVNIDNAVVSGDVSSSTTTTSSVTINSVKPTSSDHIEDITINVNSGSSYVPRWVIAHKNVESGGSSGSDFCIQRYADDGTGTVALNIQRSDFSTVVQGGLTVNGSTITAVNAAVTCNTLTTGTVTANTSLTTPTATVSNALNVGNNLNFSSTTANGNLQVNGKIAFTQGNKVDFTTNGNSSVSTNAGGFLRMTDSAGGIGFGNGTTTGGVVVYGPNSVPTSVSGFSTYTSGTTTFGTNSSSLAGNAVFNNLQAGIISWTGNSVGTRTVTGLNSSSIVTVTPRSSGALYGGGVFSVDTNSADTLRVYTQNSGSYAFNYFVARF